MLEKARATFLFCCHLNKVSQGLPTPLVGAILRVRIRDTPRTKHRTPRKEVIYYYYADGQGEAKRRRRDELFQQLWTILKDN